MLDLNELPAAISEAEAKTLEAAQAWEKVIAAQRAIVANEDIPEGTKSFAVRGVLHATETAYQLRKLARAER
jgi:hypothetical protein